MIRFQLWLAVLSLSVALFHTEVVAQTGKPPAIAVPEPTAATASTPPVAKAPFNAAKAREYQEAAAKFIGQPVEITNSIGMKLILIPSGEFEMGSNETEDQLKTAGFGGFDGFGSSTIDYESPLHRVKLSKPFYMGMYEVTLNEFLKFYHAAGYSCDVERLGKGGIGVNLNKSRGLLDGPRKTYLPWSWGHAGQTMNHPVVNISWSDCAAFCLWLSEKEGVNYRLPTEAEWEFACRAGTTTRYSCGDDLASLEGYANVSDRALMEKTHTSSENAQLLGAAPFDDGSILTAAVGRYRPNPFGLHDMHGNVYEWCRDWWARYQAGEVIDPRGSSEQRQVVTVRGGSWFLTPTSSRSAARMTTGLPEGIHCQTGFRIVRDPLPRHAE